MGIQVSRRISFQQTHDMIWGLSYVCFRLILQANLCFVLSCGIRVASMSNVDSIPFLSGILIFLCEYQSFMIIEIVMSILVNRCASLQVDPIIPTFARSTKVFSMMFVSSVSKLPLFSRPPTLLLQGLGLLNQVSILFI